MTIPLGSEANHAPLPGEPKVHPQAITLGGEALVAAAARYNQQRAEAIRKRALEVLQGGASINTETLQIIQTDTDAEGAEVWTALQAFINDGTLKFGSRGWHLAEGQER
jgi:hypothetical protein